MVRHTNARLPFVAVLTLAILFAAPAPAFGWNNTGHSVIAYIAHKRLSDNARKQIDDLLREHFRSYKINYKVPAPPRRSLTNSPSNTDSLNLFARASWWADDIRGDRAYTDKGEDKDGCGYPDGRIDMRAHRTWHFIDLPFTDDDTEIMKPGEPNLLTVTKCLREALKNPAASRGRKAYALIWLIHLVGDIHQPLHCATRFTEDHPPPIGDSGGNLFKINYNRREISLHTYWDALLGTSTYSFFIGYEAGSITARHKPNPEEAEDLSEENWAAESFEFAKSVAYTIEPDHWSSKPPAVTGKYNAEAERVASSQAVLAGYRLANILNEAFKSSPK